MYSSGVMIPYDPVFTVFINNLILIFFILKLCIYSVLTTVLEFRTCKEIIIANVCLVQQGLNANIVR